MDLPLTCDIENIEISIPQRLRLVAQALKIRRGTIAVLTGPNGSGKSTLGRYICRIVGVEKVIVRREIRPNPAPVMVWQSLNLFPMTVRKNISIVRKAGFDPALRFFNVWVHRDVNADNLSGGERQKLAIARSFVTDADMIAFDEPTSSLDGRTIEDLVGIIGAYTGHEVNRTEEYVTLMRKHRADLQGCVLIITHDLRFVRMLSRFERLRVFSVTDDPARPFGRPHYVVNSGTLGEGYTIEQVHEVPPDLFTADFFSVPNVIGFTSAAERPRGPEDFCSRNVQDAVGWIVLRDSAIQIRAKAEGDRYESPNWQASIIGTEYLGGQKRVRLSVTGQHGLYEISVPDSAVSEKHVADLVINFNLANERDWPMIAP
jgi:ABC-type cobalamin/Fe3+-siderophores transport system ATPase subunit